ncbi:6-phospho-beta-glucosidase [Clavibacter michiganensis]|uniref:6-phospho-beta-glucosidase n=1 Tax=Clavibacter michiganensis subsp. michiganensis (strain NCPPB 382) TaxID=443906 RepID=A5CMT4_CLAM3|nr:6-phospho-beta-glucosidase [Clavibacter michiganensis]KAF0259667.1 6-phospho-alpha-glucosidase [Clavibacter michiganensis subsp. michiganensis]MBE3078959.1 6-phospho-beta-glucosidase [Clavibacter michiganensis subsp. michiganensis]MBF4637804.1 6-phospho-beta-glucosidase [Clavibacter michiganensis subsp. michiganensis]MDO4026733.1 6-phospho-beta-glucosidase [Clavibacter michiganensis]MDO4030084.1 6-phospho-beta-glucosidase [Clavibacter michiganensis]
MRLTILGGGGFRVPLVYSALLRDHEAGRVDHVALYDTDEVRLTAVARVLAEQAAAYADAPVITLHTDLDEALAGAAFVFSAIRVGGMAGRSCDERLGMAHGVIGQETVGYGGISYALRTLPVVMDLAERIRVQAPDAWVINFTNPAGVVTEAMSRVLGDRVIGICDSPIGLARRVLGALGVQGDDVVIDYAGLNHLGWLRGLRVDGRDVLPDLMARPDLIGTFEEGRLFGAEWVTELGAVPNEYLHYYYFRREVRHADQLAAQTRGAFLVEQQGRFYEQLEHRHDVSALALWERTRLDRETTYMATNRQSAGMGDRDEDDLVSGGYEDVAIALMRGIAYDQSARLILNVRNRGTLAALDADAVVEVPCVVDASGAHPVAGTELPDFGVGLVTNAKYVERQTIEAGLGGSRAAAVRALAHHPLVDSVTVARSLLEDAMHAFPALSYLR